MILPSKLHKKSASVIWVCLKLGIAWYSSMELKSRCAMTVFEVSLSTLPVKKPRGCADALTLLGDMYIWYHMIIYDMYVLYIYIIYIYKWILSTPDPPSLRILMQEWYSRQESGEEGWTYLDNCGYSNQKGSGVLSSHFDISWYLLPSANLGKPGCKRERQAADWRKRVCRRGLSLIAPWDGYPKISQSLKVMATCQDPLVIYIYICTVYRYIISILWFESYDSSRFERLAVSILFGGAEFELNTMVLSNAIQDHPGTLWFTPKNKKRI